MSVNNNVSFTSNEAKVNLHNCEESFNLLPDLADQDKDPHQDLAQADVPPLIFVSNLDGHHSQTNTQRNTS